MDTEFYSFTNTSPIGLTTTVSFSFKTDGLRATSFASLCNIAAKAFGYAEQSADEAIPDYDQETLVEDIIVEENTDDE